MRWAHKTMKNPPTMVGFKKPVIFGYDNQKQNPKMLTKQLLIL